MEAIETTDATRKQYASVVKALQRDLSGYRISLQSYAGGAVGFGAWRKVAGGEEGWAVIVTNPIGVLVGSLITAVRRELLSAIQSGDLIGHAELAMFYTVDCDADKGSI